MDIKVTLKDGSVKEFQKNTAIIEAARQISPGLARAACAARVDGRDCDLRDELSGDCTLEILTFDDDYGRRTFRHTASHVLAQAVKRLMPAAKLAIGPATADGFYYDIDTDEPVTAETLDKISAEMK